MIPEKRIRKQLGNVPETTSVAGLGQYERGKVRGFYKCEGRPVQVRAADALEVLKNQLPG